MHSRHIILACLLLLSSCSVKEDRTHCPCLLQLDLQEAHFKKPHTDLYLWCSDLDNLEQKEINIPSNEKQVTLQVPKGKIKTFAMNVSRIWTVDPERRFIRLKTGQQSDSIFTYSKMIECMGESAKDTIQLHKQWCTIKIVASDPERWQSSAFEINSRWSGFSFDKMETLEGNFLYQTSMREEGFIIVRVPRQGDDHLLMKVKDPADSRHQKEIIYPLGEMMAFQGYDWRKKDLDDLLIRMNTDPSEIQIEIEPWKEESLNIEI